jgi:hypothetical protein
MSKQSLRRSLMAAGLLLLIIPFKIAAQPQQATFYRQAAQAYCDAANKSKSQRNHSCYLSTASPQSWPALAPKQVSQLNKKVLLSDQNEVRPKLPQETVKTLTAVTPSSLPPPSFRLVIEGIDYNAPPGGYYEACMNLPPGQKPAPKCPYYIGNLTFFGVKRRGHATRAVEDVDVTQVLQQL